MHFFACYTICCLELQHRHPTQGLKDFNDKLLQKTAYRLSDDAGGTILQLKLFRSLIDLERILDSQSHENIADSAH